MLQWVGDVVWETVMSQCVGDVAIDTKKIVTNSLDFSHNIQEVLDFLHKIQVVGNMDISPKKKRIWHITILYALLLMG